MKKFKKYFLLFSVGAVGYATLELLWRGHTHWSMMIAGGICFITISLIESRLHHTPIVVRAAISAGLITVVELVFGLVFNVILHMGVWDYSDMPYNLFGQICPTFSLLWGVLSLAVLPFAGFINKKIGV